MDQSEESQQQQNPMTEAENNGNQTGSMVTSGSSSAMVPSMAHPATSFPPSQHQLAYQQAQHFHHQQQQQQNQQLQVFWANQLQEIEQTTDFKNHSLPLARIKKIMKADEDVRMISAEAPIVFAKACEMFILELTLRSWIHTEENKRRTLQKNDIAAAITRTDIFDFLVDIVPRDELKDEGLGLGRGGGDSALPYYYVPQHLAQVGHPGMMYAQPGAPVGYMPWPQPQPQPQQQQQQNQQQQQHSQQTDA